MAHRVRTSLGPAPTPKLLHPRTSSGTDSRKLPYSRGSTVPFLATLGMNPDSSTLPTAQGSTWDE